MLIRKTPKGDYIKVDSKTSIILGQNGFIPKYMDNQFVYYIKSIGLIKFMEGEGLNWKMK